MLSYLLRRLLLALPTLLIISLVTFAMSRYSDADPVKLDYGQKPSAYLAEVQKLGLDQPAFYFSLTSLAFPDTLYKIVPLDKRDYLEELTRQNGNWVAVNRFWETITAELDPDLEQVSGPVMVAFKSLRQIRRLERMPGAIDRLREYTDTLQDNALQARLQQQIRTISGSFNTLQQQNHTWKIYVPALHWYGLKCQYHRWLSNFISGNPGYSSVTGNPLFAELRPALVLTLLLNGLAMLLAYLVGVPLGVLMARYPPGRFDRWARTALLFLYAMPVIWLGSLLILLLSRQDVGLGLIHGMNAEPWQMSGKSFWHWLHDNAEKIVLPVLTLSLHTMAILAIQMRGGILEVAKQDYIRTARAKGLSENRVYWRHAFRNGLFPVITIFAHSFPAIFGGSLVIEYLFDFPGMGSKMQAAFGNNDYAVLFAMVMFVAFVTVVGSVLADILYAWADPRVRFARR